MPLFSWLTQSDAIAALRERLYDPDADFWLDAELWGYISEGLRHWNGLTEQWNVELRIDNANGGWINVQSAPNSPRPRTLTDADLYTQIQNMLLEPPTGAGTWTGTPQFSLADLQESLQYRMQEVIQATACNLVQLPPTGSTPNVRRIVLADNVLQSRRMRFLGVLVNTTASAGSGAFTLNVASSSGVTQGMIVSGTGLQSWTYVTAVSGTSVTISLPTTGALSSTAIQFSIPITLTREDTQVFNTFEPDYLQTVQLPQSWSVVSESPLTIDTDYAPNIAGYYDILALVAQPAFAPPTPTVLTIPNDWAWLPMYGALADLLGRESEATDRPRAAYCLERYTAGLEMMQKSNWLLQARIDNVACDTPSLMEMDADFFTSNWQESNQNLPAVVQGGIDFVAPTPRYGQSVYLTLVGNAPLLDTDFVQVSRDDWEAVLDYSQHLSAFKMGGQDFSSTMPLLKDFYRAAAKVNQRILSYGIFTDTLKTQGQREERVESRP